MGHWKIVNTLVEMMVWKVATKFKNYGNVAEQLAEEGQLSVTSKFLVPYEPISEHLSIKRTLVRVGVHLRQL